MLLREELPEDYSKVALIHDEAFGAHGAAVVPLLADLRASLNLEPGLSLIAEDDDGQLAGHVLFTANLLDAPARLVEVQVLSPVAVRTSRQRQGVGTALIKKGLELLDSQGVPLVFLEGSPDYYSRLGFLPGAAHGFRRPSLRIPEAGFQVHLLTAYAPWMSGTLVYRSEFWAHDLVGLRD